jgi:glutamate-5-semialdehyde dehydrogenase
MPEAKAMHAPNPSTDPALTPGEQHVRDLCVQARAAARALAALPPAHLDGILEEIAFQLEADAPEIFAANALDIAGAEQAGLAPAMVDRLRITEKSLNAMITGVRQVLGLPQPLGEIMRQWERPNGIRIKKVRVPIGVIAIIYESRPNVTVDAAVLCLKTGNATVLRGGKEAIHSNRALIASMQKCKNLPVGAIQLVADTDRALVPFLCRQKDYIDVIIPRGGHSLIDTVVRESHIPVIKHAHGVCSVFIHAAANPTMAEEIVINAKTQRPGVCNAIETLLVDRALADQFLLELLLKIEAAGVEIRGDETVQKVATGVHIHPATEADWTTEYLNLTLAVRVVDGLQGALDHLAAYSSKHSDCIVTEDALAAERYLNEVDSATVYWNASTRFTDGGEFGFGAEIGISTDKLHARGPMGLEELTSYKYIIRGDGQIRH